MAHAWMIGDNRPYRKLRLPTPLVVAARSEATRGVPAAKEERALVSWGFHAS